MKSSLRKWKKITGRDATVAPENKKMVNTVTELRRWMLRECDRADYLDWMPYKTVVTDVVRTYYVNTNAKSAVYTHQLVMRVYGRMIYIEEWDHDRMISSVPAVVEKMPSTDKPETGEKVQLSLYLSEFDKPVISPAAMATPTDKK